MHDLENNFKQNNILKLKQIFPEVFCEDQIDFEKLKLVLGAENLAGVGERYQLDAVETSSVVYSISRRILKHEHAQNTRLTPSLDLDILNGIMRQAVLQQLQTYLGADTIIETHITRDMLERAEKIRLSNALRGVFEADLVY